jgi:hypothetical protein
MTTILTPAALRETAAAKMSTRYQHIPTDAVVAQIESMGYYVADSSQARTRKNTEKDTTIHLVRMRHNDHREMIAGEMVPEIVVRNSHNGYCALQLMAGIFRVVCSNGLISGDSRSMLSIPHRPGMDLEAVFNGSLWVVEQAERGMEAAQAWKGIRLRDAQLEDFAARISAAVRNDGARIAAETLFASRRNEPENLWTHFNNAQQTLTEGGYFVTHTDGQERKRTPRARGIRGVEGNVNMNRRVWSIAEEFAASELQAQRMAAA